MTVKFGTRPDSPPLNFQGKEAAAVWNKTFRGVTTENTILFEECHDIYLSDIDLAGCTSNINILLLNCTGDLRMENIRADTGGFHLIQFDKTVMSGYMRGLKLIGSSATEDIISFSQSGGLPDSRLDVSDFHLENPYYTSDSGSGVLLGDSGGSHINLRNGTVLNGGQVGVGIAGGYDIHVTDNTIYGERKPSSNVGLYVWDQTGTPNDQGVEVARNRVKWTNSDGASNGSWNAGNLGPVAGWSTNKWNDSTIKPAALKVVL